MTYPTITPIFLRTNGIDPNTVTQDEKREAGLALYEQWITDAIRAVTEYCQQPVIAASREVWFTSLEGDGLGLVKILPFTFTTTATLSARSQIQDSWTTISTDYYRIAQRDKNYYLEFWNFTGGYQYRLNCTVGYAETAIPATIQKVIIDMASWAWKESQMGKGLLGMNSQGVSGGVGSTNTSYADMPERFKAALAPYRIGTI